MGDPESLKQGLKNIIPHAMKHYNKYTPQRK